MMMTHGQNPVPNSYVTGEWKDAVLHARISIGGTELAGAADKCQALSVRGKMRTLVGQRIMSKLCFGMTREIVKEDVIDGIARAQIRHPRIGRPRCLRFRPPASASPAPLAAVFRRTHKDLAVPRQRQFPRIGRAPDPRIASA